MNSCGGSGARRWQPRVARNAAIRQQTTLRAACVTATWRSNGRRITRRARHSRKNRAGKKITSRQRRGCKGTLHKQRYTRCAAERKSTAAATNRARNNAVKGELQKVRGKRTGKGNNRLQAWWGRALAYRRWRQACCVTRKNQHRMSAEGKAGTIQYKRWCRGNKIKHNAMLPQYNNNKLSWWNWARHARVVKAAGGRLR